MENFNAQTIQNLLETVSSINQKYEEMAKLSGENFNVFRILKIERSEVRMHSAFLAELLNPTGSHGCGHVFLKLFIHSVIGKDNPTCEFDEKLRKFEPEQAVAYVEFHTGFINEKGTEGGRIDILIKDNYGKAIIIENKIDAGDQDKQLIRYHKFNRDSPIFYLTKFGKDPSEESLKYKGENENIELKKGQEFKCISYEEDILNWLEECKKEAVNHPMLRETISQYIYLIKHLTNQTMNESNETALIDAIISKPENIESAKAIAGIFDKVKYKIVDNLKDDIKRIANELGLKFSIQDNLGGKDSGFWFYKEDWCYCIYFYFESKFESILVGIDHLSNENKCSDEIYKNLKNYLKDFTIDETKLDYTNWIWVAKFQKWENTSWANIKEEIPASIKETTEIILKKLDTFNN